MKAEKSLPGLFLLGFLLFSACTVATAQRPRGAHMEDAEFGPNVRAYLGYLRDEQEVVDDRASRREIKRSYYVHNSNRIFALRQMAIRLARESDNDYLPELEAVSPGELDQLFDEPLPKPSEFQAGEVLEYKLKYLGSVAARGERFYVFARLDPYEQTELRKQVEGKPQANAHASTAQPTAAQPAANGAPAPPRHINTP